MCHWLIIRGIHQLLFPRLPVFISECYGYILVIKSE